MVKKDKNGFYPLHVRLTDEQYEKLRYLAYKKGVTPNEAMRLLLESKKK